MKQCSHPTHIAAIANNTCLVHLSLLSSNSNSTVWCLCLMHLAAITKWQRVIITGTSNTLQIKHFSLVHLSRAHIKNSNNAALCLYLKHPWQQYAVHAVWCIHITYRAAIEMVQPVHLYLNHLAAIATVQSGAQNSNSNEAVSTLILQTLNSHSRVHCLVHFPQAHRSQNFLSP
jgi:hypothetical protein